MAHRLLPFRQYDENDVVNLFALECNGLGGALTSKKPADDGINADGVLVTVDKAALGHDGNDVIDVSANSNFMATYSSPVGRNPYPTNPMKVKPAASGDAVLGVTMCQTLTHDENGESLLFNPVKKDELNAVLSGQTVPVLSKGIVTLHENAFDTTTKLGKDYPIGTQLAAGADGKFVEAKTHTAATPSQNNVGFILATGDRGFNKADKADNSIGADTLSGRYYVVKLDC